MEMGARGKSRRRSQLIIESPDGCLRRGEEVKPSTWKKAHDGLVVLREENSLSLFTFHGSKSGLARIFL